MFYVDTSFLHAFTDDRYPNSHKVISFYRNKFPSQFVVTLTVVTEFLTRIRREPRALQRSVLNVLPSLSTNLNNAVLVQDFNVLVDQTEARVMNDNKNRFFQRDILRDASVALKERVRRRAAGSARIKLTDLKRIVSEGGKSLR